jgi:GT2 family glycosyltransferase
VTGPPEFEAEAGDQGSGASADTPGRICPPEISGHLDFFDGSHIVGWITDRSQPATRLTIDVSLDGVPVARVVADQFRADVLEQGFGDGRYGFRFLAPDAWFDGRDHSIQLREPATGHVLSQSPLLFNACRALHYGVALEGSALTGWAALTDGATPSIALEILDGGQVIALGMALRRDADPDQLHYRVPLPDSVLDGRPHAFSVRATAPVMLLGDLSIITPYMLTPETALREYTREGLVPALSDMAGLRYQAFVGAIEALSRHESADGRAAGVSDEVAQLLRVHRQLVRGFDEQDRNFGELRFPAVEKPTVSVVIPVHNKFAVTYHCLAALLLAVNRVSFEVIVVDDGSSDQTCDIPALVRNIGYVRNDSSQGFVKACNAGAGKARGDYIVLLNNDTEPAAGWLDELIWPFAHFAGVGLTGAKLLYPDGSLQEAGGIVWNNGDPWNYGRGGNAHEPRYSYTRQVDYLSGACVMVRRDLWQELQGLDETFAPAYFEDTDLAFRIRAKGFKTVYCPLAQVVHFEGISSGTSTASGMKRYQEINRPKFKQRWIAACRGNGRVGVDPDLQKDRNIALRVLVLDAETPMPDKNAGSYAAIQEMRMLQALGFKCTFAPLNIAWMGHYTAELQRMGVECLHAPFFGSVSDVIQRRGKEFDLIYVTRFYVAKDYLGLIREFAPQAKLVLNNADLHFLRELRAARHAGDEVGLQAAATTREEELQVMRNVDMVLCYTDVESAVILSHNPDGPPIAKCPWAAEVAANIPGWKKRSGIAFLGGFNHLPNAEAVEWFVLHVLPLLRERLPAAKFRVFGSNIPDSLLKLVENDDQVVIEGWVPEVDAVYNSCRVFVAPLQSGAGIKGKVIGALAHGIPCVLSPVAVEGIPVSEGKHAAIAGTPEEWVEAICRLYGDEPLWTNMSDHAQTFAREHYGFQTAVAQMQEALEQVDLFTSTDNAALQCH